MTVAKRDVAFARLVVMRSDWLETPPDDTVRSDAERLLQLHPLRTGDAFQLAAALYAQRGVTTPMHFVCLDKQLTEAARGEGFTVEP